MEVNTRLQVEHPVTECTTGIDVVKLQIHVARGGRLEGASPRTTGHAIEARLNAEDPENGFAPAPGVVERFRILTGPGVRVDTGVAEGDAVPPEFDSMIAKIIACGQDRKEALSRLQRTLRESVVVVNGGASNKAFLLTLLNCPDVQAAQVDVGWLGRMTARSEHLTSRNADVALVQAAIETYVGGTAVERTQFYASALRGRPQVRSEVGRTVALRYGGQSYSLKVYRTGPHQYRVNVDGKRIEVLTERLADFEYWLTVSGRRFRVVSVPQKLSYRIEVDGIAHRVDSDEGGVVHAPAPAVVVSIAVKPGDIVAAGDRLAVLEAMKMEMQVVAPFAGQVRQIMTIPYVQVDTGDPLVAIEPAAERDTLSSCERVEFRGSCVSNADAQGEDRSQNLEEIRRLLLGFDIDPGQVPRLAEALAVDAQESNSGALPGAEQQQLLAQENQILSAFVDLCSLFQREPEVDESLGGEAPSREVYLFSYLRMLETRGEGLPPSFVESVRRALAHYGVLSLERSDELEESLFWIYKSHQRMEQQISPVLALLERRLALANGTAPFEPSFRQLLDRITSITRDLYPAVSNMAREVCYRCFDKPLFERARKEVYSQLEEHLAALAADPQAEDQDERVKAMVECPQPLVSLFAARFASADAPMRQFMLEVLTRRYYRIRSLENVRRSIS
jgi:biotin carboxyl carrier protein